MTALLLIFAVAGMVATYRLGYTSGHLDALLERKGHQPLSHRGRKLHRHLSVFDGEGER